MQAADGPNSSQLEWHQDGVKTIAFHLHPSVELFGSDVIRMEVPSGGVVELRHNALSVRIAEGEWRPRFGVRGANRCIELVPPPDGLTVTVEILRELER